MNLNVFLNHMVASYERWTYAILFLIVFCETGLVILPFLPGDSLLFAVGALSATEGSILDPFLCFLLLAAAAILGDTVNYTLGYWVGPKAYERQRLRFIKKEHLDRTHAFYERHGGKTIVLARFVPIIRTFAPFVAGIGQMSYRRFLGYNVLGGLAWPALLIGLGHTFAEHEFVKKRFSLVIVAIIAISCLPIAVEWIRHRRQSQAKV